MDLSKLKIGLHQDLTVTGDIKGNMDQIKIRIVEDMNDGVDLSIFPETAVTGYMCGSLWDKESFVRHQSEEAQDLENYLWDIGYEGAVIIGYVDYLGNKGNGYPHLKNAAAVITKSGRSVYHKQLLAYADHHEDKKYFDRGDKSQVFEVHLPNVGRVRIGIPICEDIWHTDHQRQIATEMVMDGGADLLVNINQSYFYYGKQRKRYDLLSGLSNLLEVPIISCNALGVGDILKNIVIFDGGSMVFNDDGEMIKEFPRFKEHNESFVLGEQEPLQFLYPSKYEEITWAILFEQKEFFRVSGPLAHPRLLSHGTGAGSGGTRSP
jgi:NAD+ synthase (glutamine-hydrolysing)